MIPGIPARPTRPPDRLQKERTLPGAPRSRAAIVACALLAFVPCSARASAALEPYARDPDIGHSVRKALIRLQAHRSR